MLLAPAAVAGSIRSAPTDPGGMATDKEDSEGKASTHPDAGPTPFPHRLPLSAFSGTVGRRPTGLQEKQAKLFVERFRTDFKEMSMQKTVLPCSLDGLLPFVAPDGNLPCPSPSTFNALKFLQANPEELARAEPPAKAQMEKIFKTGVQVECATTEQAYASGT